MNDSEVNVNELLGQIRSGTSGRNDAIEKLYEYKKLRNSLRKMLRTQGWPSSEFDSIFNNALIQFVTTVIKRPDFTLKTSIINYILIIARHSYIREMAKERKVVNIEGFENDWEGELKAEDLIINEQKQVLIQELLSKLGKNCREVLMYWASSYSMKEIAELLGYKSDMMARKKKYQCFKELSKYVGENPKMKSILRSL